MDSGQLTVRYGNSELYAVPAIHFDHVFAAKVNRICADQATRPQAVAVELGPAAAAAVRDWLKELGIDSDGKKELPVMLGLLKKNRLIRASLREKAFQLQKETGKDLSELPADLLHRKLEFFGYSLLCLSPTDSIIEAIRCGTELDIPVFGIDLEEMAGCIYKPVLVQDSGGAKSLLTYIDQNARVAATQRAEEIDHRREIAMAARLKTLLNRYQRVVYTCGMAHWLRIRDLLKDASVSQALLPDTPDKTQGSFKRVVVHPLIAAQYTDLFPAIAKNYEKSRLPVNGCFDLVGKMTNLDSARIFRDCLKKAYRKCFNGKSLDLQHAIRRQNLEKLGDFEAYLGNLSLLNHRLIPDLSTIIKAAQETMGSEFASSCAESFMKFPWAWPKEFPGCDLLSPSQNDENESGRVVLQKDCYEESEHFYIRTIPPNNYRTTLKIPYEWEKIKELKKRLALDLAIHTWRPWDHLISSMSLRAISAAAGKRKITKSVAFEGSLLEGIDIKTTVRAYSRGEENFYVRDFSKERQECLNPVGRFPVVWILQPESAGTAEWIVLQEPYSYMRRHVRDKVLFEQIIKERGPNMVSTIAYGNRDTNDGNPSSTRSVRTDRYDGVIIFQPICWTNKQFARWAEMTGCRRTPFCNDSFLGNGVFSDLATYYGRNHGIRVREFHWSTTMILLALPFAKDILVVVVPENYHIDQAVHKKAKKYGIEVCPVSHNLFSQSELDRLSLCHLVPALTHEPECLYTKDIEKEIGELQTDNRHLVPQWLLDFGNET